MDAINGKYRNEFQSTRPRGRTRLMPSQRLKRQWSFNPRVLAGGRDFSMLNKKHVTLCFNPRVLAGGRDKVNTCPGYFYVFQSTRPRGRTRLLSCVCLYYNQSFNPRVLAGGRDYLQSTIHQSITFQSTRPRGRTRLTVLHCRLISVVSIHASSREDATRIPYKTFCKRRFNPRVLAGGRDLHQ